MTLLSPQEAPRIKTLEELIRFRNPEESAVVNKVREKIIELARDISAQIDEGGEESPSVVIIPKAQIHGVRGNAHVDIPGRVANGSISFPDLFEDRDEEYDAIVKALKKILGPSEKERGDSYTEDICRRPIFSLTMLGFHDDDSSYMDMGMIESVRGMRREDLEVLFRLDEDGGISTISQEFIQAATGGGHGAISWGIGYQGIVQVDPRRIGYDIEGFLLSIPDVDRGPTLFQILQAIREKISKQGLAS